MPEESIEVVSVVRDTIRTRAPGVAAAPAPELPAALPGDADCGVMELAAALAAGSAASFAAPAAAAPPAESV
jgi:hypothetical protein